MHLRFPQRSKTVWKHRLTSCSLCDANGHLHTSQLSLSSLQLGVRQAAHQHLLPSPWALLRPQQPAVVLLHPARRRHFGDHAHPHPHSPRAASQKQDSRREEAADTRGSDVISRWGGRGGGRQRRGFRVIRNNEEKKKSDLSVMQRRIRIFMELCVWTHLENMKEDPQRHIVFDGENWNSFEKILSTVRLDTLLPSSGFCIKHATFFLLCQLKMLNLFFFSSPLFYSQGVVVCQKKKIKGIFYCSFYARGVAEKNFVILHYTLNPLKLLKYKLQVWNNGDISSFYLVVQQKYSIRVNCVSDTTAMENWLVYHQPTYIWK